MVCCTSSQPQAERNSPIRYWNLPTGSHIAFVEFPAKDSGSAIPLIFLHGGPGGYEVSTAVENDRSDRFRKLANLGFNVYLYDQIGGGLSGRLDDPSGYTVDRHVQDLERIRVLVGNKPFILIAGSWGATLASHYMAKYPVNILKAIFISPKNIDYCELTNRLDTMKSPADLLSADLQKIRNRFGENIYQRYIQLLSLIKKDIRQAHAFAGDDEMDKLNDSLWSPMMEHYVYKKEAIKALPSHGMGWWSFLMTSWNALMEKPIKDALRSNHTPILVIRGESDIIPEETAREYCSIFQNVKWVNIPQCGHLIGLEQPDVLYNVIEQFLRKPSDSTAHNSGNNDVGTVTE